MLASPRRPPSVTHEANPVPANELAREIELLVRARFPILYLVSHEERRTEKIIRGVAERLDKSLVTWTSTRGFQPTGPWTPESDKPAIALPRVSDATDRAIFLFKDLHPYLEDPRVVRSVRDLSRDLRHSYKTVVILAPVLQLPPELEKDVTVLDVPLPGSQEIESILEGVLASVRDDPRVTIRLDGDIRERMIQASLGLTASEAESTFCKAVVEGLSFDESDLDLILAEKKQIIRKGKVLEYYELDETLENVGGLDHLKEWLESRQGAFSERARAFGLPDPKGLLLLGVQGCGKSLTSKAIASKWRLPLLRMDVGSVFSAYIGSSEENMRRSIKTAESLAPCVLWLDEIEKAFAGMTGGQANDSGTSQRVFGTFLTWMQEKTRPVFVVATANSIAHLPPEMLRKGRFDEIFFIDLPKVATRREIFSIHLERRKRDPGAFDVDALAATSEEMSGAEIEQGVVGGLYRAFADGERELTTDDVLVSLREIVPLAVTMREKISELRDWARDRARPAD